MKPLPMLWDVPWQLLLRMGACWPHIQENIREGKSAFGTSTHGISRSLTKVMALPSINWPTFRTSAPLPLATSWARFCSGTLDRQAETGISSQMEDIRGVAFSADEKWLATGKTAGHNQRMETVEVREVAAGKVVHVLQGNSRTGSMRRVWQFSPDGRYLNCWAGTDYYLRKWDMKNGRLVTEFQTVMPGMELSDGPEKFDPNRKESACSCLATWCFRPAATSFWSRQLLERFISSTLKPARENERSSCLAATTRTGISSIAHSPTKQQLAVWRPGGDVTVHHLTNGKELLMLPNAGA